MNYAFTCRRRAMTLMELLVVIGIIAVLASIMVPIVGKVRDQANRTKCMNNAKQLMHGIMVYAGEYDNSLPFSNWASQESSGAKYPNQRGWLYWLGAPQPTDANAATALGHTDLDYTKDKSNPKFVKTGGIYKYLRTIEVYHCPIDEAPWPAGTTRNLASYQMNGAVSSYGNAKVPCSHKMSAFRSTVAILWECNEIVEADPGAWNDGANSGNQGPPNRHGKGGSVAFIDGHVEWIQQTEFTAETSRIPNRFTADPLNAGM